MKENTMAETEPYYCIDDDYFCDLYDADDGTVRCQNCENVYEPDEMADHG